MPDEQKPKKNLSDISHLFLSSIRDRQTNGAPRPQRIPPKPPAQPDPRHSIDMTPEEFAQAFGGASGGGASGPQVTAVLGSHLNGKQFDHVKRYARHLAADGRRIGLIEIDVSEVRIMTFDDEPGAGEDDAAASSDLRQIGDAITELSCDLQQWLVLVVNPRMPEGRSMLRDINHWSVLTTCDHDGVVSCYRTLKGLAELGQPRLSLALLDAHDDAQAEQVFSKISSVCLQFLNWPVEAESLVEDAHDVREHLTACWRPTREAGAPIGSAHWHLVADMLAKLQLGPDTEPKTEFESASAADEASLSSAAPIRQPVAEIIMPPRATQEEEVERAAVQPPIEQPAEPPHRQAPRLEPAAWLAPEPVAVAPAALAPAQHDSVGEVIDLPSGQDGDPAIITAIMRRSLSDLVECPLPVAACPQAKLVLGRDRNLMLLAVARQGLTELRAIGKAYQWLIENRALIAMALPQLAVDAHRLPQLRLLVDQADADAEVLRPILQSNTVTVQTYRRVRWGEKLGLLLEAA